MVSVISVQCLTMILKVSAKKRVNAWICARPTTHHHLVSVIPDEKGEGKGKRERKFGNCRFFSRT